MKITFFTSLAKRKELQQIRSVMRGYRLLKQSDQLGKIAAIKEELTISIVGRFRNGAAKIIFGAGKNVAELITRQYLLLRIAGLNLNRALLYTVGRQYSALGFPLPRAWRKVVRSHGFKVRRFWSVLSWAGFTIAMFTAGAARIVKIFCQGLMATIRPKAISFGKYAYFIDLREGNLPQPCRDGSSDDIVSWYQQWPGRVKELDTLCHNVITAEPKTINGTPVISVPAAVPSLRGFLKLLRFAAWGIGASAIALAYLFIGRWWNALLLGEAALAATIRLQDKRKIARDYLFHNSNWVYRPLWTYEAEKYGSRITFYFYATNAEKLKHMDGYPSLNYGWHSVNWPLYLVWDKYQADFIRRAAGNAANIKVVGPIWFHTSTDEIPEIGKKAVAVFDIQPMRDAFYMTLGLDFDYYTPVTANRFLADIYKVIQKCGGAMVLKRKRQIGKLAHPTYRGYVKGFDMLPGFVAVNPDISALRLIENCAAVISMAYTSTALLGRHLGKPSAYYDPFSILQKNDRAAHGIDIISGIDELNRWVSTIFSTGINESSKSQLLSEEITIQNEIT